MKEGLIKAKFSKEIRKELKPLMKKNNYYNIIALIIDWSLILGCSAASVFSENLIIYLFTILIIGSRMRAFDNLMHEACHRSLFTNKFYNKWIACLFIAFPIFTSYTAYCNSHFEHHRNLWDAEKDPDTKRYRLVGLDKPQKSTKLFVKNHILKTLLLFHVPKYILGTINVNLYSKEIPKSEIWVRNIFWMSIITLSIIFNFWLYLILFWFVLLLTTFQIIRYWAEMAEHSGLNNGEEITASRNTFGMPWTIFLLHPHHDNYHLVHHLFPAIPHYNLKKAHEILMTDTKYREAHHCTGFFKTTLPGFYSVIKDICTTNSNKKGTT
ncbi:fatty acid desaturase family protein [Staphylococcus pettenkoferi]|uniref:fatty acid desaturase family protein n=1 Tax=Staphylococcus pettenkoferi TaxID=170573 RepID=UPI0025566E49|nr:fatty acid desaturase family protein [Staphylococcus pettenkoferi]MDK7115336.1 fatty acid desaturase family protein [Staphylococcus pettenkoferi]